MLLLEKLALHAKFATLYIPLRAPAVLFVPFGRAHHTPLALPTQKGGKKFVETSTAVAVASPTAHVHTSVPAVGGTIPVSGVLADPIPALASSSNVSPVSVKVFGTPLNIVRLAPLLRNHPEPAFVTKVMHGLQFGFDIGYSGTRDTPHVSSNLASSNVHSLFITKQLSDSCRSGETAGPFSEPPFPNFRCSGVGAVPKKNGKMRMIHHLSSPPGSSINDGISPDDYSLQYVTIDNAVDLIMQYGTSAHLFKLDIKNAFRNVPVRPADWHLLGICWQSRYYFEKVLPFGLRSSPAIFNDVAVCIEWVMRNEFQIKSLIHYLDDFLGVAPNALLANQQAGILLRAFLYLGIPLATSKIEGPAPTLNFLGITLDCVKLECRLPDDKLIELRHLLSSAVQCQFINQGELASLLGKLSFASRCIVPGRTFMRRLWDICNRYREKHFRIKLAEGPLEDLQWWLRLLAHWNGRSFFLHPFWTLAADLEIFTDASGTQGWGAYYAGRWMQGRWTTDQLAMTIEWKELYAVLMACSTWGSLWPKLRIMLHCDNEAVVACLKSGTSRAPLVMSLLRELFFICSSSNFHLSASHIAGKSNCIADSLSRFDMQAFRRAAPRAREHSDNPVYPQL